MYSLLNDIIDNCCTEINMRQTNIGYSNAVDGNWFDEKTC
jgi:hypothetical protein